MIDLVRQDLESMLADFESGDAFRSDPLDLIDRSLAPVDLEIVSFVVAGLSYGRVEQIQKSSEALLKRLHLEWGLGPTGSGIARSLAELTKKNEPLLVKALDGWKHRLNTAQDILALFRVISNVLKSHPSLAHLYQSAFKDDAGEHLIEFTNKLRSYSKKERDRAQAGEQWTGTQSLWFYPSPEDGSTCKRLMMWLRWMVRSQEPDLGTWQKADLLDPNRPQPSAARLFVPLDTHIFQWAIENKVLSGRSPSWKSVVEISNFFKKVNPSDPLRYDFMLCHLGMQKIRLRGGKAALAPV
jgi:uncharacterized protein (TIGR02757 family)